MSHSSILQVRPLDPTPTPRVAAFIAWAYDAAGRVFGAAADPGPRITEASAVRRMADRLIYSDPALAADLYAAASRHERFDEDRARH